VKQPGRKSVVFLAELDLLPQPDFLKYGHLVFVELIAFELRLLRDALFRWVGGK